MEVYHQLAVYTCSVSLAATFADVFQKIFRYELTNTGENIISQLETFRQNGGCLQLEEFRFDTNDTFEKEYRQVFLRTAKSVPHASFTACAVSSGDLESRHYFSYTDGYLKRKYVCSEDRFLQEKCPECGAEFHEDSYNLTEEEIRLDEYYSFSDEDLKRALTFCRNHKPELEKDTRCGCFFCREIFSPIEIEDWDMEEENDRGTALCPHCDASIFGYDSVIGESSGYPITADFLRQLDDYWKWEELHK